MNKADLRRSLIEKRRSLTTEVENKASEKVYSKVISYIKYNDVTSVHTYLPIQNEISTIKIVDYCLKNDIEVVVSKTLENRSLKHIYLRNLNDLVEGKFGTLHPKNENEFLGMVDLILVPGVGFDDQCNRLGFGAGYYDNFLSTSKKSIKIALAYDFQIVKKN